MAQRQNRATFVCDYFDEDIVYRISRRGKTEFGVIVESCENASSDEEDDDWNRGQLSWKRMKSGLTKIAWYPKGNTEVVAEKKVKLYDRSLLPGDIVRYLQQAKNNQNGYCKETKVSLTLKVQGTEKVVENVDCEAFTPLSAISSDVVCVYKSWVGYVNEVKHNVTLRCEDGSQAVVLMDDIFDFEDIWDERDDSSEFVSDVFHVGQQLVGLKRYLKKANWTSITKEMKIYLDSKNRNHSRIKATVIDVNVASVSLKWLCCVANDETKVNLESPSTIITGNEIQNVRCLNYFQKSSLQVGDEGYYVIKEGDCISPYRKWLERVTSSLITETLNTSSSKDEIVTEGMDNENDWQFVDNSDEEAMCIQEMDKTQSVSSSTSSFKERRSKKFSVSVRKIRKKKVKPSKRKDLRPETVDLSPNSRVAVEVVAEKTLVDILWQNGDIEENIPSSCLYPIHHVDNHDFFPGDFVVDNNDCSINTYGVVQRVDHSARTAAVKWFKMFDRNDSAPQLLKCEDVSVYDIKDHPDFHYRPGCCVIRITGNQTDSNDAASRVGQVISITVDGSLWCAWSDDSMSFAFPQELYIIGEYDSDDLWADSDDDSVEGNSFGSWETESERTVLGSLSSPTGELKSPISGTRKSKEASYGNLFDTLRKTITQLEEWFSQNQHLNRRNSLCPMQKIFKVCRELNTIDNMLGTNLLKLKELHSLIDTTKPPPDSPGAIQVVSNKIKKLLTCMNTTQKLRENNGQESEAHSSSVSVSNNTDVSLEMLKNLKSQLSRFCSNVDAIKLTVKLSNEEPDSESPMQEASPPEESNTEEDVIFREDSDTSNGVLKFMDSVPDSHKFKLSIFVPKNQKQFLKQVRKEAMLLESSLPSDIVVKGFSDRLDLFSVLIKGAKRTPYEDGLFLFDVQLPSNYPDVPPVVHYLSFCNDRLNPNLYDNGRVCVSLLGTWSGKGTEVWTKSSTLLQVLISIQGLILVDEPYYNEAGYLKQKETLVGQENSRLYNEMVVVKLVQSMTKLIESPGDIFADEIREHFTKRGKSFINRLEKWLTLSKVETENSEERSSELPEFPLLPGSQGFCLSLQRALANFKQCLKTSGICVD